MGPQYSQTEFLRLIHRIHGYPPPPAPARVAVESGHDPLPLGAFRIAIWIHSETTNRYLRLTSKDAARPETIELGGKWPTEGVEIERVEARSGAWQIHVRRGPEQCIYEWNSEAPRAGLLTVRKTPQEQPGRKPGLLSCELRAVPYWDEQGRAGGLRVTGFPKDGAFAASGLKTGDVIEALDGEAVASVGALQSRLAGGWRPTTIVARVPGAATARAFALAAHRK